MEESNKQEEKSIGQTLDENLNALERIVSELNNDQLPIDQAIEKYTQGMELAILCRRNLSNLNQKVMEVRTRAELEISRIKEEENNKARNPQSTLVNNLKDLDTPSSNVNNINNVNNGNNGNNNNFSFSYMSRNPAQLGNIINDDDNEVPY